MYVAVCADTTRISLWASAGLIGSFFVDLHWNLYIVQFEGWSQDWRKSDGWFSPNLISSPWSVMKITTFLSVNNENLGAIARMSNDT